MVSVDLAVEGWWSKEWGTEDVEEESLSTLSLWEAEVAALSDEQLATLQDPSEDDGVG
jgi:hypothetical protein